ncbi:hypothetical protein G7072_06155 [Nocardioides sp. HDW12B]|uniref:hypothetical protein n=1 Tax=Nocardioides sp. HDW12B TaxID=2714939 RepID=UPI00140C13FB|nr:hypothetical protein [Nocardioides sp. HDW12B]QIK65976.1 hypothetical protein G7072_06155 [Nocardioides sp. HDW12B]
MTTPDLHDTGTTPTLAPDMERRLLRTAGFGGVGAALAWMGQPVLVTLTAASGAPDSPAWADIEASRWTGVIEVVIFTAIGISTLVFVLATWQLLRARAGAASVAQQVGLVGGVVSGVAWLVVASESFRLYTSIGAGLPDLTDDPELQRLALEGTFLDITGGIVLFAVGFTLWTVLLVTTARRAGVVGRPSAVVAGLSLLAPVAGLAQPFSSPWWAVSSMLCLLVLGCAFLVRSRR